MQVDLQDGNPEIDYEKCPTVNIRLNGLPPNYRKCALIRVPLIINITSKQADLGRERRESLELLQHEPAARASKFPRLDAAGSVQVVDLDSPDLEEPPQGDQQMAGPLPPSPSAAVLPEGPSSSRPTQTLVDSLEGLSQPAVQEGDGLEAGPAGAQNRSIRLHCSFEGPVHESLDNDKAAVDDEERETVCFAKVPGRFGAAYANPGSQVHREQESQAVQHLGEAVVGSVEQESQAVQHLGEAVVGSVEQESQAVQHLGEAVLGSVSEDFIPGVTGSQAP
eukprot:7792376-Pyramimonas_sp.AAC.1